MLQVLPATPAVCRERWSCCLSTELCFVLASSANPFQKRGFSVIPLHFQAGIKPSDTWCSYLCSAEERQEDVAEGPKGFPCHFCLLGPTSGLKLRDLYPANCCWLWSPGRWLPAGRVSHWHCCSCGWYLSRRDTKVGCVGHRGALFPGKNKKSYTSRLGMQASHET